MDRQHKRLAEGRWNQLSLCEQMANIGSEVSRALNWQRKNKKSFSDKAIKRAHELIELTIDSVSLKSQIKELTRLKEVINDYFYGENQFSSTETQWEKYFNHFNYAARRQAGKL